MPYFINDSDTVCVSSEFIRDKLPGANPTFVKVYVYLLYLASKHMNREYSEIAETLGLLESDLMHAINYWEKQGELLLDESGVRFISLPVGEKAVVEAFDQSMHKSYENIAEIITENQELSDMFMLAQEILGKTITEKDMETVYWFYQELNMPPVVILRLLEYCVSKGKNRMSYIEKVAVSWNEMGLNTPEGVDLYLQGEEKKTGFLYSIRKIMGISDRSLSQIEEKYLVTWHDRLGMSEEMIALAYEYCIIQTAKLSFPYMDKIITRWKSEGIETIEQAENDNRKFKNRTKQKDTAFKENKYNQSELEALSLNN